MISLNCPNCGGLLNPSNKGELVCSYCETKSYFSDSEIKEYLQFRTKLLQYAMTETDAKANKLDVNLFHTDTTSKTFITKTNQTIRANYLFHYTEDEVDTYVTLDSVIFVFKPHLAHLERAMLDNIKKVEYPSADLKNLSKYIPTIKVRAELDDNSTLVAISKPENSFPLFAFGYLDPRHIAWVVSRMENICCLFAFNDIAHNSLSLNNILINPRTHEAFFYGGWWNVNRITNQKDLQSIRQIAKQLLEPGKKIPTEFTDFLNSRPREDAYSDFEYWDTVIENGFGGHKFVKF